MARQRLHDDENGSFSIDEQQDDYGCEYLTPEDAKLIKDLTSQYNEAFCPEAFNVDLNVDLDHGNSESESDADDKEYLPEDEIVIGEDDDDEPTGFQLDNYEMVNLPSHSKASFSIMATSDNKVLGHVYNLDGKAISMKAVCSLHGSSCTCWLTVGERSNKGKKELAQWIARARYLSDANHQLAATALKLKWGMTPRHEQRNR